MFAEQSSIRATSDFWVNLAEAHLRFVLFSRIMLEFSVVELVDMDLGI